MDGRTGVIEGERALEVRMDGVRGVIKRGGGALEGGMDRGNYGRRRAGRKNFKRPKPERRQAKAAEEELRS